MYDPALSACAGIAVPFVLSRTTTSAFGSGFPWRVFTPPLIERAVTGKSRVVVGADTPLAGAVTLRPWTVMLKKAVSGYTSRSSYRPLASAVDVFSRPRSRLRRVTPAPGRAR